jgi:hypothetical protein
MTTEEFLRRHFSRMGARLRLTEAGGRPWGKIRIDIGRDRSGEFFDLRCDSGVVPEVLDVQPERHHMLLMVRDGSAKNKYLLGRDERHWFAAAVPGDNVHDVRTAIDNLRPVEVEGRQAVRQGEWFFVADRSVSDKGAVIRGAGKRAIQYTPCSPRQYSRRGTLSITQQHTLGPTATGVTT